MHMRLEVTLLLYKPLCFSYLNATPEQLDLHNKSSEFFIKTRSPAASLAFKGKVTQQTTVKWSIQYIYHFIQICLRKLLSNKCGTRLNIYVERV